MSSLSRSLKNTVQNFPIHLTGFALKAGEKDIRKNLFQVTRIVKFWIYSIFNDFPHKHIQHLNKLYSRSHRIQNIANCQNIFQYSVIYTLLVII